MNGTIWRNRLDRLFRRKSAETDLEEEIHAHLEIEAAENRERGMSERDAYEAALRKFGNAATVREDTRFTWGVAWWDTLLQDLSFATRIFRRTPGVTAAAVATLALAIGAATAVYSIAYPVLVRPLPFKNSDTIYSLKIRLPERKLEQVWIDDLRLWQKESKCFEQITGVSWGSIEYGEGEGEYLLAAHVSASFFPLVGVQPILGRAFRAEEDQRDAQAAINGVMVVSHSYWRNKLGGDPNAIGRKLRFKDRTFEVIGVMPENFRYPEVEGLDAWMPLEPRVELGRRGRGGIPMPDVIARMHRGVTVAQAEGELANLLEVRRREEPTRYEGATIRIARLQDAMVATTRPILLVVTAAAAVLFLVGSVNVCGLLLARAVRRQREITTRLALGASFGRLTRQLLTESAALAVMGSLLGLVVAYWTVRAMLALHTTPLPRQHEIQVDEGVFLFALSVGLLAVLLFGLWPAVRSLRECQHGMISGGARSSSGKPQRRILNGVLVVQVALTFTLLIFAGLIGRTLVHLLTLDPGFKAEHVLALWIRPTSAKYKGAALASGYRDIIESVKRLPAVVEAGTVSHFPFADRGQWLDGVVRDQDEKARPLPVERRAVSPDYFSVIDIHLLHGRRFSWVEPTPVAIVSSDLAERLWPGQNALGQQLRSASTSADWLTVVGVVEKIKDMALDSDPRPIMYCPLTQSRWESANLLVRSKGDPASIAGDVAGALTSVDGSIRIRRIKPLEEHVSASLRPRRLTLVLVGSFAVLALILAVTGLYGAQSYSVQLRKTELGIRQALGATPANLMGGILAHSLSITLGGMALGAAAAFFLQSVATSVVYGVSLTDPITYGAIASLVMLVCLAAAWFPARRAASADPLEALRYE